MTDTDYNALVRVARDHIEHVAQGVPGTQVERIRRGENDDPRTSLIVKLADAVEALSTRVGCDHLDGPYRRVLAERDALQAQLDSARAAVARALIEHHGMVSTDPVLVAFDQATRRVEVTD